MRHPMILGIYCLKKFNAKWDFQAGTMDINGETIKTFDIDESRLMFSINELSFIEEHPKFFKKIDFSQSLTPVDVEPHKVELIGDAPVINSKISKYPKVLEEEIAETGKNYMKAGWIKFAEGSGNLLSLVPIKKNNKLRITTNVAPFNKHIKDYPYPMKIVDDMLQLMEGFSFISIFDMEKGYFQIPLHCDSQKYFRVHWPGLGVVCWTVMVQGDKTAPAKFQHEMDRICYIVNNSGKLTVGSIMGTLLDDIAVKTKSNNWKDHYNDLSVAVNLLETKGWRANPDKTFLYRFNAKWLGHLISREGMKPIGSKVDGLHNITNFKSPTDVKRFLGTINEYRKFIPNLAQIAEPLYQLTRSK